MSRQTRTRAELRQAFAERYRTLHVRPCDPSDPCDDDYGPCAVHGETLAQREGASLRTADELCAVFVFDASDLVEITDEEREAAGAVDGWVADPDEADALRDIVQRVEGALPAGVVTYWEDGYRIVRLSDDCPLRN